MNIDLVPANWDSCGKASAGAEIGCGKRSDLGQKIPRDVPPGLKALSIQPALCGG